MFLGDACIAPSGSAALPFTRGPEFNEGGAKLLPKLFTTWYGFISLLSHSMVALQQTASPFRQRVLTNRTGVLLAADVLPVRIKEKEMTRTSSQQVCDFFRRVAEGRVINSNEELLRARREQAALNTERKERTERREEIARFDYTDGDFGVGLPPLANC